MQSIARDFFCIWLALSISTVAAVTLSAAISMLKSIRSRMVPWSMTSTWISLKMPASSLTLSATCSICLERSSEICSASTSAIVCCELKRGSMGCAASSSSSKKPPPPPPLEEAAPAEPPPLRPKSGLYSSIAWPLRFARYALCPRVKSLLRSCSCLATRCSMFLRTASSPEPSSGVLWISLSLRSQSLKRAVISSTVRVIVSSLSSSSSPKPGSRCLPDTSLSSLILDSIDITSRFKSCTVTTQTGGIE
mmetsp:Transcript_17815/g.42228  ORF Transcript_17815/g.42228 Transcript_17815/m.42228 type:complete len:250 (+) Transcript_17815:211-960(+)